MRGEEVPATPSEDRRKKTRFSSDGSGDDSRDIFGFGAPSSLASTRHSSEVEVEIDELPESPVKTTRASQNSGASAKFRPIFNDDQEHPRRKPIFGSSAAFGSRSANAASKSESDSSMDITAGPSGSEIPASDGLPPPIASGNASTSDGKSHSQFALHPPSPPPGLRLNQRSGPSRTKTTGTKPKGGLGLPVQDEIVDEESSDSVEIQVTRNVAWGARNRDAAQSSSDILDDMLIQPRPSSPLPESDSGSVIEDLDLSGDLRQALTISSVSMDADNVVRESRDSTAWLAFVQGHQNSSSHRSGEGIWNAGEVAEGDSEDWESEPDGWNASQD